MITFRLAGRSLACRIKISEVRLAGTLRGGKSAKEDGCFPPWRMESIWTMGRRRIDGRSLWSLREFGQNRHPALRLSRLKVATPIHREGLA